ncbi:MAG: hypothetical protein WBA73_02775 [Devosia sp.]
MSQGKPERWRYADWLLSLLSNPATLAIMGIGGALVGALLTALIQPLWSNFIAPKSRLHVKITPYLLKLPKFLQDGISDYRYNYKLNIKPTEETKERLWDISRSRGHFRVAIENKSKSSIRGLTIKTSDNSKFLADMEGEEFPTFSGKSLELGTLHPESTILVHIWTLSDGYESRWQRGDELITVRAESYDKIQTTVEIAGYVRGSYFLFPKKPMWRAAFVFWMLLIFLSSSGLISKILVKDDIQIANEISDGQ